MVRKVKDLASHTSHPQGIADVEHSNLAALLLNVRGLHLDRRDLFAKLVFLLSRG